MVMQLHERVLAPSLNFHDPNPNVDWARTPFRVNTELREWPADPEGARRGGVSAFGFGGTNFHAVLEEYVPGRHRAESAPRTFASAEVPSRHGPGPSRAAGDGEAPSRDRRRCAVRSCSAGATTPTSWPSSSAWPPTRPPGSRRRLARCRTRRLAEAAVRVAIDYADAADLAAKAGKAVKAFRSGSPALWKMLRAQGVFVGRGPAPKVAFLYTGQGSQYVNMLKTCAPEVPVVAADVRRGRPDHDAAARPAALVVHLHRRDGPGRRRAAGAAADAGPRSPSRPCSPPTWP